MLPMLISPLRLLSFLSFFSFLLSGSQMHTQTFLFAEPIDALSIRLPADDASIAVRTAEGWHRFAIEKEFDPLLMESDLVMFPNAVHRIVLRGQLAGITLHPIRISSEPAHYNLAATTFYRAPRIMSRDNWGANEEFLYKGPDVTRSDSNSPTVDTSQRDVSTEPSSRVDDCERAQKDYPQDFRTTKTITQDSNGERLRWARRYSPEIDMLVVHHTALTVSGDTRSPVERMRALYEYHANNRGWGDIGYNFVIDEQGGIYEGRSGGDYVVGGHAYCANVRTLGIALMGNFELEQPTLKQIQSLQWLLKDLAARYDIDLTKNVSFHGKTLKPVVRHQDLVATECPGYYVAQTINQIRSNVIAGNTDAGITFPVLAKAAYKSSTQQRLATRLEEAGQSLSRTFYRAKRLMRVAERQDSTKLQFYRDQLAATSDLQRQRSTRIQKPMRPTGTLYRPAITSATEEVRSAKSDAIRIRLSYTGNVATVTSDTSGTVRFGVVDNTCVMTPNPQPPTPNPRIGSNDNILTVTSWKTTYNRFRGVIECRVIDGQLTLINELPLEDYMAGLSEQPDTEPKEKQKAFAVAARSYAAFYLQEGHEKFPGMPYDGSDSGASFQSYSGVGFEDSNPNWTQAVRDTAGSVLKKNGSTIKAAYYSSNDGRTRSPAENGWQNFPNAEVFASKPDPWCKGMQLKGHGVGMSGCGAEGQANEGKQYSTILEYYYPGTVISARVP